MFLNFKTFAIRRKNMALVLVPVFALLLIWISFNFIIKVQWSDSSSPGRLPWLLESGLVKSDQAEVRLVMWFDGEVVPPALSKELIKKQWNWKQTVRKTPGGISAVTVSAQRQVSKEEEAALSNWYSKFALRVKNSGGYLYLDERVPEVIDMAAYLASTAAEPLQWVAMDQSSSIAAYRPDNSPAVQAGSDLINIQMMTRSGTGTGKSVLALPALLEEF